MATTANPLQVRHFAYSELKIGVGVAVSHPHQLLWGLTDHMKTWGCEAVGTSIPLFLIPGSFFFLFCFEKVKLNEME